MRKPSLNEQSALNVIGSIVVVAINVTINLVLSPYIVKHLGVEANGYITLANNFVSYLTMVSIALNSMVGRFILIDNRRGYQQSANEYYSSVLIGDWMMAMVFFMPMLLFVVFIDRLIKVPDQLIWDIRILFGIVFFNYIIQLCVPQWQTATYCTNNLYLRSLKNAVSNIIRAVSVYLLFRLFTPHSYYVAVSATFMTIVSLSIDYTFYKKLMPELKWSISWFRWKKVKELVSSGIWNTISQCGNLLLEGFDILIANIFINPVAAGVLALSKMIPNMINQITGTVSTTYGPRLTYLYADGKINQMENEIKNNIVLLSVLSNIPIGTFFVFGIPFFKLWVPSQDAFQLTVLSSLSLLGLLFAGLAQCYVNIFGVVNKLKLNSLMIVGSGLINLTCVFLLLKYSSLGIYSVVITSSVITIIRIMTFVIPYSARLIDTSSWKLTIYLLRGAINVVIPIGIGLIFRCLIGIDGWGGLVTAIGGTAIISALIYMIVVLNRNQRETVLRIFHVIQ